MGKSEGKPDEIQRVTAQQEAEANLEVPKASMKDFWAHYSQWKYGKVLLGTAGSWFFLDVAYCMPSPFPLHIDNSTDMKQMVSDSTTP